MIVGKAYYDPIEGKGIDVRLVVYDVGDAIGAAPVNDLFSGCRRRCGVVRERCCRNDPRPLRYRARVGGANLVPVLPCRQSAVVVARGIRSGAGDERKMRAVERARDAEACFVTAVVSPVEPNLRRGNRRRLEVARRIQCIAERL